MNLDLLMCVPFCYNLFMPFRPRWNKKQLEDAAKAATSIRQTIKKVGLIPAGGNYELIKKYIKVFKIDTSHFKGKAWNKGTHQCTNPGKPLDQIMTKNSNYQSFKLKQRLFRSKMKPEHCEECKWAKHSVDGYLPLELDHINGDKTDNRLENLRVLCPNCHSLKPTHRGKNRKKLKNGRVAERHTLDT